MDNGLCFVLGMIGGIVFTVILTASCLSDLKERYEIKRDEQQ